MFFVFNDLFYVFLFVYFYAFICLLVVFIYSLILSIALSCLSGSGPPLRPLCKGGRCKTHRRVFLKRECTGCRATLTRRPF